MLTELFPSPEPPPRAMCRALAAVIQAVAVCAGSILLLLRIPGIPAWDGIYAEDLWVFLPQALQHPWHLVVPYGGYMQFVPRVLAQFAALLPLPDAAAFLAVTGALIASGCALFVFHASAGFIRSSWLRGLLAAVVVLLPIAPMEIADSAVGSPWYLLIALFWAVLWRPRSRAGMVLAAIIAAVTAASTVMAFFLLPLLAARVIALPRLREHAVTAGWAAGCLLQAPFVIGNFIHPATSRGSRLASLPHMVAFYGHDVVLRALGWRLSWVLESVTGRNGATLITGGILAVIFGWILVTQGRRERVFVVTALLAGFVLTVVAATLTWWVPANPVTQRWEPGSRYTDLPIFLIAAAAIAGVDSFLRRTRVRLRTVAAVSALVVLLAAGWITDFRYGGGRSRAADWPKTFAVWLQTCQHSPAGVITVRPGGTATPCANMRR